MSAYKRIMSFLEPKIQTWNYGMDMLCQIVEGYSKNLKNIALFPYISTCKASFPYLILSIILKIEGLSATFLLMNQLVQ